uniref:Uncharacterized protein n=1 Tax=Anopheles maculatus TaxID=74869 RepID=A0A182T7G6_9DIPT
MRRFDAVMGPPALRMEMFDRRLDASATPTARKACSSEFNRNRRYLDELRLEQLLEPGRAFHAYTSFLLVTKIHLFAAILVHLLLLVGPFGDTARQLGNEACHLFVRFQQLRLFRLAAAYATAMYPTVADQSENDQTQPAVWKLLFHISYRGQ